MKPASLVAVATLTLAIGSLGIAHSMPQDAPKPAADAQEAEQASDPQEAAIEQAIEQETAEAKSLPFLDLRRVAPIIGNAEAGRAKSEVCGACHGENGLAVIPNLPNLAGQSIDYLYWELVHYHRGDWPESPMTPLATDLTDQDMRDLAAYYASLQPRGLNPVAEGEERTVYDPQEIALGERIYMEGVPADGIPPCQGCHGVDGRGHPLRDYVDRSGNKPYSMYPYIRGQQPLFLLTRLTVFKEGGMTDSSEDHLMIPVAQRLSEEQIAALAKYLSGLPH